MKSVGVRSVVLGTAERTPCAEVAAKTASRAGILMVTEPWLQLDSREASRSFREGFVSANPGD